MSLLTLDLPAPVWQVRPCVQAPLLGLELRDGQRMEALFATYQLGAAQYTPLEIALPDWWTGLEAVAHGVMLLHRYADPATPTHLGVYAYDAHTGRQLWALPQARYVATTAAGFLLETGGTTYTASPAGERLADAPVHYAQPRQQFPGVAVHTDAVFDEMAARIAPQLGFSPQLQLEYLRVQDTEIWLALDDRLGAHLCILTNGVPVHRTVLMETQQQIGLDSFFVWQHHVVYVQGRQRLCLWPLR